MAASPLAPVGDRPEDHGNRDDGPAFVPVAKHPSRGAASIYETRNAVARNPLLVLGSGSLGRSSLVMLS